MKQKKGTTPNQPGADTRAAHDWTNAETRAVHHAVATDPDVLASWREFVAELRHAPDAFPSRGVVREALACGLREEAAQALTSLAPGLLSDLADIALARVDWPELAEKLLSEIEGTETSENRDTGTDE